MGRQDLGGGRSAANGAGSGFGDLFVRDGSGEVGADGGPHLGEGCA